MLRPYGKVDKLDHKAKYRPGASRQQLVARIKKSSKDFGQTAPGQWFAVEVVGGDNGYPLRGNSNNYRMSDVAFGVRLEDDRVVELK